MNHRESRLIAVNSYQTQHQSTPIRNFAAIMLLCIRNNKKEIKRDNDMQKDAANRLKRVQASEEQVRRTKTKVPLIAALFISVYVSIRLIFSKIPFSGVQLVVFGAKSRHVYLDTHLFAAFA